MMLDDVGTADSRGPRQRGDDGNLRRCRGLDTLGPARREWRHRASIVLDGGEFQHGTTR
jgi:hypothetical protein